MGDTAPRTLVLIGLRVSGKTTLGKRLAADLGRPFVDLDDRVASHFNVDRAGEALRAHGLDAFRAAETDRLVAALTEPGVVLALGGGTPTAPGASGALRAATDAVIVYLHAEPATLADRLRAIGSASRPSLTGKDPADEFDDLYAARDPIFRSVAHEVIDADDWDEDRLAATVANTLARYEASAD